MRADSLARSMMNNDMTRFWKDVHKITNSKVPLATKVDGCVGDTNIAKKSNSSCAFNLIKSDDVLNFITHKCKC